MTMTKNILIMAKNNMTMTKNKGTVIENNRFPSEDCSRTLNAQRTVPEN
jgi:hypothetical protein